MSKRIVVPTLLYGVEIWALNAREKRIPNVMELEFLRIIFMVTIRIGLGIRKSGEELVR